MLQWPAGSWFSRPEADLAVRGRIQPAEGGSGRPRPDRAGRGRPGAGRRAGRGPAEGRRGEPHQTHRNRLWAQTLIFLRKNYRLLRKADFLTTTPNVDDGESGYPVGALCQGGPRTQCTPTRGRVKSILSVRTGYAPLTPTFLLIILFSLNQPPEP